MLWIHSILKQCPCNAFHDMLCYDLSHFCTLKNFVMHRHITYCTQSTVCQGGFSNKFLSSSSWAYAGFAKGGQEFFFFFWGGGGFTARGVAMRLLGGFVGILPRKKNCNGAIWCVLEHIFIFFLLSKSLKISFLHKNNYKL